MTADATFFWLPMDIVRKRRWAEKQIVVRNRDQRRKARAERNAKIVQVYLTGRTVEQVAIKFGLSLPRVRVILSKADALGMGGHLIRVQRQAQFEELERLIRKHRHTLPPGFRSAGEVMARVHSRSLTTAG